MIGIASSNIFLEIACYCWISREIKYQPLSWVAISVFRLLTSPTFGRHQCPLISSNIFVWSWLFRTSGWPASFVSCQSNVLKSGNVFQISFHRKHECMQSKISNQWPPLKHGYLYPSKKSSQKEIYHKNMHKWSVFCPMLPFKSDKVQGWRWRGFKNPW